MKYCYANKLTPQDKIKIILSFISFLLFINYKNLYRIITTRTGATIKYYKYIERKFTSIKQRKVKKLL